MRVERGRYLPPADMGVVHITLNIQAHSLEYLTGPGFRSSDGQGPEDEDVASNIRMMWQHIGRKEPQEFTSLAARVVHARGERLHEFGEVVAKISLEAIRDDAYIVNGDFKGLGYHLRAHPQIDSPYRH